MTYQVLARKWRPQDFASLVGQQAVVTALTNAIAEGRIAQAYLFSGIRGVGKTTAARVFAKALNCEKFGVGSRGGPCNECRTCQDITAGSDLDVLEIDAATYSKVEQVRELAESLKYGPARDRYKVVVLDEVHRLSRQAFDALLKIIEEPPPHLVFLFATTEIDAVPATILSRCQEFHFRRVGTEELAGHLRAIADAESIRASDGALALIARAGEGSVRDAVAILDQLATFGGGTVEEGEAARLLGGIDLALFHELLSGIGAGDAPAVSALARRVEENGWDPRQVHANFLAYCRDALHLVLGGADGSVALPADESARLGELARGIGYENLLRLLHQLLGSETSIRRSDAGALALEIAWLRAAELPKLVAIEELLAGGSGGPAGGPSGPRRVSPTSPAALAPSAPSAPAAPAARSAPAKPSATTPSVAPAPPAPPAGPGAAAPVAPVPVPASREESDPAPRLRAMPASGQELTAFVQEVSRRKANLAGLLDGLASLDWRADERTIAITPHDTLSSGSLGRAAKSGLLDEAAVTALGAGATVRLLPAKPPARRDSPTDADRSAGANVAEGSRRAGSSGVSDARAEESAESDEARQAQRDDVREHPIVQSVLSVFGGEVRDLSLFEDDEESNR